MLVPVKWLVALLSAIASFFASAPVPKTASPATARAPLASGVWRPVEFGAASPMPGFEVPQAPLLNQQMPVEAMRQQARIIRVESLGGRRYRVVVPPRDSL